MADRTMYTDEAAITASNIIALSLANADADPTPTVAKLRFFDDTLTPNVQTVKADLVAAEVVFGGYPVGGYEMDAFASGQLSPLGGAVITSPLVNVAYTVDPGAVFGGGWIEDGDGKVRVVFVFDPVRPVQGLGQGFQFLRQIIEGRNYV